MPIGCTQGGPRRSPDLGAGPHRVWARPTLLTARSRTLYPRGMADKRQLTRRGQERRDKLLDFATARFAEKGFHPTSVSDIVDGVGVGKGVFYWYFESKDELLEEILRDSLRDLRSFQAAAIADAKDPLERLEAGRGRRAPRLVVLPVVLLARRVAVVHAPAAAAA